MNKPLLGLVLGGILGVFDGLSALVSAPEVAPQIVGIVIGSTFKGLLAGVLIGWFANKVRSLPAGLPPVWRSGRSSRSSSRRCRHQTASITTGRSSCRAACLG